MHKINLKTGDQGEHIKQLNTTLSSLGYALSNYTDSFDQFTYNSVVAFQNDNNLEVTGVVNEKTMNALEGISPKTQIIEQTSINEPIKADSSSSFDQTKANLCEGATGKYVEELQNLLKKYGYNFSSTDGIFDKATKFATIQFQNEHNLISDGIVGAKTWAALYANDPDLSPESILPVTDQRPSLYGGDINPYVTEVQKKLKSIGFYKNKVDGFFGKGTLKAVKDFQKAYNLQIDGIVSQPTWLMLDRSYDLISKPSLTPVSPNMPEPTINERPLLKLGSRNQWVTELQSILDALNFYTGDIDGLFGQKTDISVRDFQTEYYLTITGIVDTKTWKKLDFVFTYINATSHEIST